MTTGGILAIVAIVIFLIGKFIWGFFIGAMIAAGQAIVEDKLKDL